jgi:nitrate/nitrite transporter NarK
LLGAVAPQHTGVANGVNSVARSLGSALASALVATLVATGSTGHPPEQARFTLCSILAAAALALIVLFARFGMNRPPRAGEHSRAAGSRENAASPRH